ncbi:MAG TPA: Gfo/Idh/MocA family oxidoreductase [Bacteroidales bacterium]|nr:Gfo/Idh/MocA family oxidoreductase [Bacteroidales bacterium]HOK74419.1 Gfo/Idh/MocA family oxidoreductase [Bacteroidales bacterium]HOM40616.1 Gfo/Idh/MocA family oxidoreductase [Bacteroidales bacterium]HOU31629.1 Gfo/Idh/MocA family oxidoreductase [Bacteroidales bacterium]HPP92663.1 Gfo/Idh/MocA family oxidoreductase [Bacteroidales bacterium]
MKQGKKLSRREFLGASALGMAGIMILPAASCGRSKTEKAPSDLVRLGFIGLGRQAMFLLNGFLQVPGVEVLAGCDVYGVKRTRFERRVNEFYSKAGKKVEVKTYEKFQDLLARKDIDAVVIATPDHYHALIAIAACKAGKDVYLEKPLTFTIYEGQQLVKAVRENNRILQVGSQQRSDDTFRHAVNLVQSGAIGKITLVNAYVGAPPTPYNLPPEPVPADLNWDLWLGPLPANIHYNSQLNPPISLDPPKDEEIWGAWRWYKETGGGFTTDWGAHMFDIAQWGLGMDNSGPVEASPIGDGTEFMSFKYANGVVLTSETWDEKKTKGVKFHGENGWIEVARGYFNASDPKLFPEKKEEQTNMPYETRIPHQVNFIESVRTRKDPVATVEIGHRTCTVCNIGNIACDLKRTVKWNPETETFVDDEEATKRMHYTYREPWKLV